MQIDRENLAGALANRINRAAVYALVENAIRRWPTVSSAASEATDVAIGEVVRQMTVLESVTGDVLPFLRIVDGTPRVFKIDREAVIREIEDWEMLRQAENKCVCGICSLDTVFEAVERQASSEIGPVLDAVRKICTGFQPHDSGWGEPPDPEDIAQLAAAFSAWNTAQK